MSRRRSTGFTLIEMMIVLLILGVIAAIAVPSYRDYVLRANRADAKAALLALATAQEKYYLQCNTYTPNLVAGTANTCPPVPGNTNGSSLNYSVNSERSYYRLSVTAADEDGWTAEALPEQGSAGPPLIPASPQLKDSKCQFFSLTSLGVRQGGPNRNGTGVTAATTAECWGR